MDKMLAGLPFTRYYIDDVVMFSNILQKHVRHCKQFLNGYVSGVYLCLHHGKCKFFHDHLPYLGYMIVLRGLGIQQVKVDTLQRFDTFAVSLDW